MNIDINNWHDLNYHEYCTLFPQMNEDEYAALVADISMNGLAEDITVIEVAPDIWEILDGRNRHLACMDAGVPPHFQEYEGKEPLKFAISKNVGRRHLSTGQLAALASEVADAKIGQNQHGEAAYTREQAAIVFGTSVKSIQRYREIASLNEEIASRVALGQVALMPALQEAKQAEVPTAEFEGQQPTEPQEEFNDDSAFGTGLNATDEESEVPLRPKSDYAPLAEDAEGDMVNNRMRLSEKLEQIENREALIITSMSKDQYADLGNGFTIRLKSGSQFIDIRVNK